MLETPTHLAISYEDRARAHLIEECKNTLITSKDIPLCQGYTCSDKDINFGYVKDIPVVQISCILTTRVILVELV